MPETSPPDNPPRRGPSPIVWVWFLVVLIAGYFLAGWLLPTPRIGIVRLEGDIYDAVADHVNAQLDHARSDRSIVAVVLKVNSPGGGVTASESLYYSLLSFREHKPLVVSIDTMAASGGYYAASAGDYLFAKPSSSIGNIGVVSFLPTPSFVDEELIATGPFKLFGSPRSSYIREMEMLKQGFLRAVTAQRRDALQVDEETLSRGEIYVGIRALDIGLIDEIGTLTDAVEKAAEMAKVTHYETIEMNTIPGLAPPTPPLFLNTEGQSPGGQESRRRVPTPGLYYLSLTPGEVAW